MNQKLLLELNQDLQKQPNPFCSLEEVAELYHLTCLLDENIPNFEVPDGSTPSDVELLLSNYLKDRDTDRCESIREVVIYPNLELGSADLEPLEYIDNQKAFDLLASLVSLYSSLSINTVWFTEYALEWREDDLEDDPENEFSQDVVASATEILETKTAKKIKEDYNIPTKDHICALRLELSLNKNEVPAFLETYISDALDTFEKCTCDRFNRLMGEDDYYHNENHSPLYYNVFFLYPETTRSHDNLMTEIDEGLNADLQEHSGAIGVGQEHYQDIQFFIDAVNEYKEVVNNFNDIIKAL